MRVRRRLTRANSPATKKALARISRRMPVSFQAMVMALSSPQRWKADRPPRPHGMMAHPMNGPSLDTIVNLAKRRGIAFQSSEIYGGLRSAWDYGPLGVELRRNVRNAWWRSMVQLRDDIVGLEAAIIMSPRVWEASGHVAGFSDPLIECLSCHQRFRDDHLQPDADGIVKCPNCGGAEFTEPKQFNLMFETHMGPTQDEESIAY